MTALTLSVAFVVESITSTFSVVEFDVVFFCSPEQDAIKSVITPTKNKFFILLILRGLCLLKKVNNYKYINQGLLTFLILIYKIYC